MRAAVAVWAAALVLALAVAGCGAQGVGSPELVFPRTLGVQRFENTPQLVSNMTVEGQRLTPCSSLEFPLEVPEKQRAQEGEQLVFILEFFPRTSPADPFVPPHDDDITVTLRYGPDRTAVEPSSIITEADVRFADGSTVTYLGSGVQQCEIRDNALVRGPAPPYDVACGATFYCDGIAAASPELFLAVETGENENPDGILFDFRFTLYHIPVQEISHGAAYHEELVVSPPGVLLYKPSVAQYHYMVELAAPDGSDEDAVRWAALRSNLVHMVVSVGSLRVGEEQNRTAESQGVWSLSLNKDDLAVVNRGLFGGGYTDVPVTGGTGQDEFFSPQQCFLANDEQLLFDSSQSLRVATDACLEPGRYFIAVGMSDLPQYNETLYSYRVRASVQPLEHQGVPLPEYLTLDGVPLSATLSPRLELPAQVRERYYVLPRRTAPAPDAAPGSEHYTLDVTVFDVRYGSVAVQITTGGYGFQTGCASSVERECWPESDVCVVHYDACEYTDELRFVTVQVNGTAADVVEFSLSAHERAESDALRNVRDLALASSHPLVWEESAVVGPHALKHYVLELDVAEITEEHLLTVHAYGPGALQLAYAVGGLALPCSGAQEAVGGPDQSVVLAFNFCELVELLSGEAADGALYFSVRAALDRPEPVRSTYTVRFTLWERAVELQPGVTVSGSAFPTGRTSQQYRVTVPDEVLADMGPHDRAELRVRVSDMPMHFALAGPDTAPKAYGGCARPAGRCPCHTADRVVDMVPPALVGGGGGNGTDIAGNSTNTADYEGWSYPSVFYYDFLLSPCECEERSLYVAFSFGPLHPRSNLSAPVPFDLTAYVDVVRATPLPAGGGTASGYLWADNDDALNLVPHTSPPGSPLSSRWYFADEVHSLEVDTSAWGPEALPELRVDLQWVQHRAGADRVGAVVVIARDHLPQLGAQPAANRASAHAVECGDVCTVVQWGGEQLNGYCTHTVRACDLESGTYFMRVYAFAELFGCNASSLVLDDYALDYTLTASVVDTAPARISVGVPLHQEVRFEEYRHSMFVLDETVASAVVSVYDAGLRLAGNASRPGFSAFLGVAGPAGQWPCFESVAQCAPDSLHVPCTFALDPCEFGGRSGELAVRTFYVSVLGTQGQERGLEQSVWLAGHVSTAYTLEVRATTAERLELHAGHPRTVQVNEGEAKLFYFDVEQADVDAGSVLRLDVHNEFPLPPIAYRNLVFNATVERTATRLGRGVCGGDRVQFQGEVSAREYSCALAEHVGRWYLAVRVLTQPGAEIGPVEAQLVTVHARWQHVPVVALEVVPTRAGREPAFVAVPQPLDFDEWVHFRVELGEEDSLARTDRVMAVELADLTDNLDPYSLLESVDAWINVGAFPAPLNAHSVFSEREVAPCAYDHRVVRNNLGPQRGVVMARFDLSLCTAGVCAAAEAEAPPVYMSVRANMLGPQPAEALRANFSVRAYSLPVEVPEGALFEGSLTEYRGRLSVGETHTFVEDERRVVVQCDDRWGSVVSRPHYFKTAPLAHKSKYERGVVRPLPTNTLQLVGGWNEPFTDTACACGVVNGTDPECGWASCSPVEARDVFYGAFEFRPCVGGALHTEPVAMQEVYLGVRTNRDYVEDEPPLVLGANANVAARLEPGRYRHFVLDLGAAGFNQPTSLITLQLSFTEGSLDQNVCFEAGRTGAEYPGTEESSFCPQCEPPAFAELTIEPCCATPDDVFVYTVYGAHNVSAAAFTLSVTTTALAEAGDVFSLGHPLPVGAPVPVPTRATGANLYRFYSFSLTPEVFTPDDVVTFFVGPREGDSTPRRVFLQRAAEAGDPVASACYSSWFDEECDGDSPQCHLQIPYCTWEANGGLGEYYLGVQAGAAGAAGERIDVFVERTERVELGGAPSALGTVPFDVSSRPVDYYYRHYKVPVVRALGDVGLEPERARVAVLLERSSGTGALQLSLRSSRNAGSNTPLAGDPAVQYSALLQNAGPACDLALDDAEWVCERRDPTSGISTPGFVLPATLSADAAVSQLVCTAPLCALFAQNPYVHADAFVYAAVRHSGSGGARAPTTFRVRAEVQRTPLNALSTGLVTLEPRAALTSKPFEECAVSGGRATGGCHLEDVPTSLEALYVRVPLGALEVHAGDFLTVNLTELTEFLEVAAWFSFECEPDTAEFTPCGAPDGCLLQFGDPADGASLFSAAAGAGRELFAHSNTSLVVRVRPAGGATFALNTDFDVEVAVQRNAHVVELPYEGEWSAQYAVWKDEYLALTLALPPHHGDYELSVWVEAACTDAPPQVFRSYFGYRMAGEASTELGDVATFAPFNETLSAHVLNGGNYYVTLRGRDAKYPGIDLGRRFGRVTPHTHVTVRAVIQRVEVRTLYLEDPTPFDLRGGNAVTFRLDVGTLRVPHKRIELSSSIEGVGVRVTSAAPRTECSIPVDYDWVVMPGEVEPSGLNCTLGDEGPTTSTFEWQFDVSSSREVFYVTLFDPERSFPGPGTLTARVAPGPTNSNFTRTIRGFMRVPAPAPDGDGTVAVRSIAFAEESSDVYAFEVPDNADTLRMELEWLPSSPLCSSRRIWVALLKFVKIRGSVGNELQDIEDFVGVFGCTVDGAKGGMCSPILRRPYDPEPVLDGGVYLIAMMGVFQDDSDGLECECGPTAYELRLVTKRDVPPPLLANNVWLNGQVGGYISQEVFQVDLSSVRYRGVVSIRADLRILPSSDSEVPPFLVLSFGERPVSQGVRETLVGTDKDADGYGFATVEIVYGSEEACDVPEQLYLHMRVIAGGDIEYELKVSFDEWDAVEVDVSDAGSFAVEVAEPTAFLFNGGPTTAALRTSHTGVIVVTGAECAAANPTACNVYGGALQSSLRVPVYPSEGGAVEDACGDSALRGTFEFEVLPIVEITTDAAAAAPLVVRPGTEVLLAYEFAEHSLGATLVFDRIEGGGVRAEFTCGTFCAANSSTFFDLGLLSGVFSIDVPPCDSGVGYLVVKRYTGSEAGCTIGAEAESVTFSVFAQEAQGAGAELALNADSRSFVQHLDGGVATDGVSDVVTGDVETRIVVAGHEMPYERIYRVSTGSTGWAHVGVVGVNGTDNLEMSLYRLGHEDSPIRTCSFDADGDHPVIATDSTDALLYQSSCFVYVDKKQARSPIDDAAAVFEVKISTLGPVGAVVPFELVFANEFKSLSPTWTEGLLRGRGRQYYQVSAAGECGFHALTVELEIVSGPRVAFYWSADIDTNYHVNRLIVDEDHEDHVKECAFGRCTLQVASWYAHPRADTMYVWVSSLTESRNHSAANATLADSRMEFLNQQPLEQPSHYRIRAFRGVENCGPLPSEVVEDGEGSFCSRGHFSERVNSTLFFLQGAPGAADVQARRTFERYTRCHCPSPTTECRALLHEFACEEAYSECDACGFPVVQCRDECTRFEAQCGAWSTQSPACADDSECGLSGNACGVATRYADAEPCSGSVTREVEPTPTPTAVPTPPPEVDVAPTSGTVQIEVDFAGGEGAVVLCSEQELQAAVAGALSVPDEFVEVLEVEGVVGVVRIDGCCGRTATQLAVELLNAARGGDEVLAGTCLENAALSIVAPAPSVSRDTIPEVLDPTSSTGTDSTLTLSTDDSSSSPDDIRVVVNIIDTSSVAPVIFPALPLSLVAAACAVLLSIMF